MKSVLPDNAALCHCSLMPRVFKFKLEKVLDFRRQLEDQARMALARAKEERSRQQRVCEELRQKLVEHDKAGEKLKEYGAQDIWLRRMYERRLEQDLTDANAELARLALKLQKARNDVIVRSKERKLLEKLKANQEKKHNAEEQRKEQKEFDEMATIRHEPQDI